MRSRVLPDRYDHGNQRQGNRERADDLGEGNPGLQVHTEVLAKRTQRLNHAAVKFAPREPLLSLLRDCIDVTPVLPFWSSQALLGGGQHLFEARVITNVIQIGIDFRVIDETDAAHLFKRRTEHLQSRILVV